MKSQHITGGGGTRLHVVETGNPQGRPILFIHGFSQCWLAWSRQMHSELAKEHRLVALDLRGHGLSEKPRDGYGESRLWADDVNAVLQSLRLEQAILSGWSYGSLVILDYIRHYGDGAVGGIQLVGGISKLGSDEATVGHQSGISCAHSGHVLHGCGRQRARHGIAVAPVLSPRTLAGRAVSDAGIQPLRAASRSSGVVLPLVRQ